MSEVLDFVFDEVRGSAPFTRLGYAEIDHASGMVVARWQRSIRSVKLGTGFSAKLSGSSLELVANRRAPRVLNDLRRYLRRRPESKSTRIIVEEGIQSSLTCPIHVLGKPAAFVFFSHHKPQAYSKENLDLFLGISDLISLQLLATSARESRDTTVEGVVDVLENVLKTANPIASIQADLVLQQIQKLVKQVEGIDPKLVERAARLSHVGFIPISEDTTRRALSGEELSESEQNQVETHYQVGAEMLQSIPALRDVSSLLEALGSPDGEDEDGDSHAKRSATLLKLVADFQLLVARGVSPAEAVARLSPTLGPEYRKLGSVLHNSAVRRAPRIATVVSQELTPGMILNQHLVSGEGDLLLSRGIKLTSALVDKIEEAVIKRKVSSGRISVLIP